MAVRRAFVELIATRSYEEITVEKIIAVAGVSRSSFYAHFAGKNDLLTQSISSPFKILADCVFQIGQPRLTSLLDHFWAHRRFTRGLFLGPVRQRVITVLVREIAARMKREEGATGVKYCLPCRLIAWQLADSILGLIVAWLTGEARCTTAQVSDGLLTSTRAVLMALRSKPVA